MNPKEWNPGLLLATSGGYWSACALHTAVVLDLFSAIGDTVLSAEEIAGKTGSNPRATATLLNALCSLSLLEQRDVGRFGNTSFGKTYLVKESPAYLGYMIQHHHYLLKSWSNLEQTILTGKPVRTSASRSDGKQREAFLMGMHNSASLMAPELVKQLDLSGRSHLLDLGGGPGTYAIHFCRENPGLNATVCDLPTTRLFAEKNIASFGLAERVDFSDTDFLSDEIKGRYDVVWMSHILHGEGPKACGEIIAKAMAVLEPGGLVAIHEFVLDDTLDGPVFPALFSLNMLLGTERGQSYSESQLTDMLAENGAEDICRLPYRGPSASSIIIGRK